MKVEKRSDRSYLEESGVRESDTLIKKIVLRHEWEDIPAGFRWWRRRRCRNNKWMNERFLVFSLERNIDGWPIFLFTKTSGGKWGKPLEKQNFRLRGLPSKTKSLVHIPRQPYGLTSSQLSMQLMNLARGLCSCSKERSFLSTQQLVLKADGINPYRTNRVNWFLLHENEGAERWKIFHSYPVLSLHWLRAYWRN